MSKSKVDIKVEVCNPMEETCIAMILITRLLTENKIDMELTIAYDFDTEVDNRAGFYLPGAEGLANTIFVNPLVCKTKQDVIDGTVETLFCQGYVADFSVFGVTIHEFCHLLHFEVFKDMVDEYAEAFPLDRLYLNEYCGHILPDELAEIMTLYISNPYLLKMISKEHWQFCKRYFKSPVACSPKKARQIYQAFPVSVKEELKEKWGIVFNEHEQKFVKV